MYVKLWAIIGMSEVLQKISKQENYSIVFTKKLFIVFVQTVA